jgi:nucleoside-diphosphate-sugar epimerase
MLSHCLTCYLTTMKILIAGCGYVGTALGLRLAERGDQVWGLRRDPRALPASLRALAADLGSAEGLKAVEVLPRDLDYVVYAASAGESSDAAYRRAYVVGLGNLLTALSPLPVRRVFFTSSTAVYAQADGEWVDESSATVPSHFAGLRTLEAEGALRAGPFPSTVLRCAGIYGPGRTRLIDAVRQGTARGSERYTNRIHRDDIAGAITHLIDHQLTDELLILGDDDPAPQHQVTRFLAERLGVSEPPPEPPEPGGRGGHKRCRNDRLKATGYQLKYPTYREGYAAMLAELHAPSRTGGSV